MEDLVASSGENFSFSFERFLKERLGIDIDGSLSGEICRFFLRGSCPRGAACPQRHSYSLPTRGKEKSIVCKHWLRGLCKKGDACEFLHEYNLRKMPECWFFTKYGECSNPECLYLHVDPNSKARECQWYARGFCKHGPHCRNKHVRNTACQLYLTGFCPFGSECQFGQYIPNDFYHQITLISPSPKYEIPTTGNE